MLFPLLCVLVLANETFVGMNETLTHDTAPPSTTPTTTPTDPLTTTILDSVTVSGSDTTPPSESVSFSFGTVSVQYVEVKVVISSAEKRHRSWFDVIVTALNF